MKVQEIYIPFGILPMDFITLSIMNLWSQCIMSMSPKKTASSWRRLCPISHFFSSSSISFGYPKLDCLSVQPPHTHHILLKFLSCISHVAYTCEREHFISSVLASERHYRRDPWPCFVPYSVSFFLLFLFCRLVQWLQHLIRPWSFFQVLRGLSLLSWKLGELIYTYTVSVVWLLYYNDSR